MSIVGQLRNRWFALKGAKRPVPAGFMKLDYLESTGTQWIDTPLECGRTVTRWDFSFTSVDDCRVGSLVSSYIHWFGVIDGEICAATRQTLHSGLQADTSRHSITIDGNSRKFTYDDDTYALSGTPIAGTTIFAFASRTSASGAVGGYAKMKLFSLSGEDTKGHSIDYTPLLALPGTTYIDGNTGNSVTAADFKPGMYDYVSNRFFVNQATSGEDFLYIPDNEVWYAADSKQTLYTSTDVVSHEFADGRGVLKFASAVTTAREWLQGTDVTAVVLPKTVTLIQSNSFFNCSSLYSINMQEGIEVIATNAFRNTRLYNTIKIPSSVDEVRGYAFYNAWRFSQDDIRSIHFTGAPTSIAATALGSDAAGGARYKQLTDIYVPWSEGEVAGAPWGATNATIHYNSTTTA